MLWVLHHLISSMKLIMTPGSKITSWKSFRSKIKGRSHLLHCLLFASLFLSVFPHLLCPSFSWKVVMSGSFCSLFVCFEKVCFALSFLRLRFLLLELHTKLKSNSVPPLRKKKINIWQHRIFLFKCQGLGYCEWSSTTMPAYVQWNIYVIPKTDNTTCGITQTGLLIPYLPFIFSCCSG